MSSQIQILLVDDDKNLSSITQEYLIVKGLDVGITHDAESALALFKKKKFDICLLDVKMPMKDGFALAEELRALKPEVSIIFLTGQKEKESKIQGLLLGADDYITKPFSMEELFLRIKNVYKRIGGNTAFETAEHQIGSFTYHPVSRQLSSSKSTQRLSEMEGQLLVLFCSQANRRITREQALTHIWQDDAQLKSRSLSVYINKLRHRLKEDPSIEIINVYGTGYQLVTGSA